MKRIYLILICLVLALGVLVAAYIEKSNFSDKAFNTTTSRSDTGSWKNVYDYSNIELANEWNGSNNYTVNITLQARVDDNFYTVTSGSFSYSSNTITGTNGTWTHSGHLGDTSQIYSDMSGFGFTLKESDTSLIEGCRAIRVLYDLYPYNVGDSASENVYNSFFIMRK